MKTASFSGAFILLSLSLLTPAFQTDQTRSAAPDALDRQVTASQGEYPTTHSAFLESLLSAHVPGGIVTVLDCDKTHPRRLTSLSPGTLRETLDAIIKANPEYRWEVDDKIINLRPVQDEPALLGVKIGRLKVENAPSIDAVLDKLFELPEVKAAITKLQLTSGVKVIVRPISPDPERRPRFSIECDNVTVREALNAIVRAHGRAVWEYKEQRCDGKTVFTVDFIATWLN